MQKCGVLYKHRFDIVNKLKQIVKTGDLIYRRGDARGPLNLPFSALVCRLTKSKFSHASMLFWVGDEIHVLEICENGTMQLRLIDWLDFCVTEDLIVARLKNSEDKIPQMKSEIYSILKHDPDYDYNFLETSKFYCTESVNHIAELVGIPIMKPELLKDIIPWWAKPGFWLGNLFFKLFTGKSLPYNVPLYYIGNETKGMLASKNTDIIYDHTGVMQKVN